MSNQESNHLRSVLDKLTLEQLQDLLAQYLSIPEEEETEADMEQVTAILEVMEQKQPITRNPPSDPLASWRNFVERNKEQFPTLTLIDAEAMLKSMEASEEAPPAPEADKKPASPKRRRFALPRYWGAYCAAFLLVVGLSLGGAAAKAQGIPFMQLVAQFAQSTFGFEIPYVYEEPPLEETDPFAELRVQLKEHGILEAVVPNWWPEDLVLVEQYPPELHADRSKFCTTLSDNSIFQIVSYAVLPSSEDSLFAYEDIRSSRTPYYSNGLTYYFSTNNSINIVTWSQNNLECMLHGNISKEDLERMIDSIHEE